MPEARSPAQDRRYCVLIPLAKIEANPFQTRTSEDPEYVAELAKNIGTRGLLQTPLGRLVINGQPAEPDCAADPLAALELMPGSAVQIAFGHNRLAAYRWLNDVKSYSNLAGSWAAMPIEIRTLSDEDMAIMAWTENYQRKDLSPLEEAQAIRQRMELFHWTQEVVAEKLNLGRSTVANKLRLLKLPEELQNAELTERQALAYLPVVELPAELLEHAEKSTTYNAVKPTVLVEQLSLLTSDQIRGKVDSLIEANSKPIDKAMFWEGNAYDLPGVIEPVCANCAKMVTHGKQHRCPIEACYNLKQVEGIRQALVKASALTGLPSIDDPAWGEIEASLGKSELEHAKANGCSNLRVSYRGVDSSYIFNPVEGCKGIGIICHHGKDHLCACRSYLNNRRTEEEQQACAQAEAEIKSIFDRGQAVLQAAFERLDPRAWALVAKAMDSSFDPRGKGQSEFFELIAAKLIRFNWYGSDVDKARKHVSDRLKSVGLKQEPNTRPAKSLGEVFAEPEPEGEADLSTRFPHAQPLGQVDPALPGSEDIPLVFRVALGDLREWIRSTAGCAPQEAGIDEQISQLERLISDLESEPRTGPGWQSFATLVADTRHALSAICSIPPLDPWSSNGPWLKPRSSSCAGPWR
ncbi:MAG: ParB/RepB/Spo0J family partition protein [Anaerolineaceae bacterium]|nr:ParB/RepB/Spo0J family partition protein [Anaerolineaceae bacterium]MDD5367534.1 ParB/RepB/Spo0J family partition protein [Anaerolineaceae bacterium]